MPSVEEIQERYAQAKLRSEKRVGLVLALVGLVGTLLTGTVFVFFLFNGAFSITFLSFVLVCLFTLAAGLSSWRKGGDAFKIVDESVRGPF